MRIVLDPHSQHAERYQCSVCLELLNNPHQDQCGHRLCLECYQRNSSETQACGLCQQEGNIDDYIFDPAYQPIPDNAIKREMRKLRVGCLHEGCHWENSLENLLSHLDLCEFKTSNTPPNLCSICHEEISMKGNFEEHIQSDLVGHLICTAQELKTLKQTVTAQNDILLSMHMQYNTIYEKLKDIPSVVSLKDRVEELKEDLEGSKCLIHDLQQRLYLHELTTYDGTLLWRLSAFADKMRMAEIGQRTSIYSPFFYTSRYGYKACLRLYLNGDGAARGSHISIFLVLVKGDYDPILQWPFNHSVSFSLLDQSPSKEHIKEAFKSDPSSSSFKKPTSDMNLPTGFPHFLSRKKFQVNKDNYVVDDTAFIKVVVDDEKEMRKTKNEKK